MKKLIIICLHIVLIDLNAQNNEKPKFRTYLDFGYFNSSFKLASNGGNYVSGGFGYKINKEFWLNLTVVKISGSGEFEQSPIFISNKTSYNNTMIIPNFSKDWMLSNKFFVGGAIGGALIFENVLVPFVITDNSGNIIGVGFSNEGESFNLGLFGELVIRYEIIKNLNLSLSTKSFLPMYFEPDSFMIGAGVELKL
jgi:hypothetical protein